MGRFTIWHIGINYGIAESIVVEGYNIADVVNNYCPDGTYQGKTVLKIEMLLS